MKKNVFCHTCIGKQPNDPWSLQDALEYESRLWLEQKQHRTWSLYAIKDCLAVELLMKAKANHSKPHPIQPSVQVPCEPPSEEESDIEAAARFTPILPVNRFSTPTIVPLVSPPISPSVPSQIQPQQQPPSQ
ncbi:unnamed protein product [Didymodactylos carnosus]|uniref:Uncharacterized protein n=1 Tax=Didymodactylos carnosus TaxID=1234261 RepID=A0A814CUU7_9BILA|nr:unnamed protein product [Didymodactylos carnosus]CAF0949439.1 unnamed protein product [Didymodactylos carnosus]CAF3703717.1 unnamed protein product [Didymodactylos carnosus]CAF3725219.1 unnamed protein product [Didymodactylos carnosus]